MIWMIQMTDDVMEPKTKWERVHKQTSLIDLSGLNLYNVIIISSSLFFHYSNAYVYKTKINCVLAKITDQDKGSYIEGF